MMHRFLFSWFLYFIIWLAFTTSFDIAEMVAGAVISFVIAMFTFRNFTITGLKYLSPIRLAYIFLYLIVFIRELVKANLNVARIVLHPKLPIAPGIVKFKTDLQSDAAKMILANSITLTPGTLSVDIVDQTYYIHWLVVETVEEAEARQQIASQFENILRKIFA